MYLPKPIFKALITYKYNQLPFDFVWPREVRFIAKLNVDEACTLYKEIFLLYVKLTKCIEKRTVVQNYYVEMGSAKESYLFPITRAIEQKEQAENILLSIVNHIQICTTTSKNETMKKEEDEEENEDEERWKLDTDPCDQRCILKQKQQDEKIDEKIWEQHLADIREERININHAWNKLVEDSLIKLLQGASSGTHHLVLQKFESKTPYFLYLLMQTMAKHDQNPEKYEDIKCFHRSFIHSAQSWTLQKRKEYLSIYTGEMTIEFINKRDIFHIVVQAHDMFVDAPFTPSDMRDALLRLPPLAKDTEIMLHMMPLWIVWLAGGTGDTDEIESRIQKNKGQWKKRYMERYTRFVSISLSRVSTLEDIQNLWRQFHGVPDSFEIPSMVWKKMYTNISRKQDVSGLHFLVTSSNMHRAWEKQQQNVFPELHDFRSPLFCHMFIFFLVLCMYVCAYLMTNK